MLVNKKLIPEENILILIKDIKDKKELSSLSEDFIRDNLFDYFQKTPKVISAVSSKINKKSVSYRKILKENRAKLRKVYGLFRLEEELKRRNELIELLVSSSPKDRENIITEILETHSSTKERLKIYSELYKEIFKITGKPHTILDLGCGINPFSYQFMDLKECIYHAYDISNDEIANLNQYFSLIKKENPSFEGYADILDALHLTYLSHIPPVDICFLFKMTDVLDRGKGHKITEEVLKMVPANYVVISFATKTMSGKKMTAPRRRWMEWLCKRLEYKYKIILLKNEIFYVINKK